MPKNSIYEYFFPIVGGELDSSDGAVFIDQICGTAFPIDKDLYLTADHVITQANAYHGKWLGCFVGSKLASVPIVDCEQLPDLDLAIIRTKDVPSCSALPWKATELGRLTEVSASGYPFAYDAQFSEVHARSMRGSIVSVRQFRRVKAFPRVYELSFQCPRGLSGAPLVTLGVNPRVVGMVLGNESTEINVFTNKEVIAEGTTTIVERYESYQLGIAVTVPALLRVQSRLLDGTLESYLRNAHRLE